MRALVAASGILGLVEADVLGDDEGGLDVTCLDGVGFDGVDVEVGVGGRFFATGFFAQPLNITHSVPAARHAKNCDFIWKIPPSDYHTKK